MKPQNTGAALMIRAGMTRTDWYAKPAVRAAVDRALAKAGL